MSFPTITSTGLFSKEYYEFPAVASFPTAGVSGRLYVATNTNNIYRWNGYEYVLAGGSTATDTAGFTANFVGALVNGTYTVVLKSPYGGTITETTTKCSSGTGTFTVNVNTVPLGGTANAVSSAEQSQAHSSVNSFAVGDDITVTLTDAATLINPTLSVTYTKG
jgi:hypothetical protein